MVGPGCPKERLRLNYSVCGADADCVSTFCYEGVCLDPGGDEDDDSLINAAEKDLGTDVFNKDTDQDGAPDAQEVGADIAAPQDSDGDGSDGQHDALESEVADADGDCIADQFDADDATPRADLLAAACLTVGVCAHPDAELGLTCPTGATAPVCAYGGVPAWESVETTCDGRDNDCDGAVDAGDLCGDGDPCTLDTCLGVEGCHHEQTVNLPRLARWVPPGVGAARSATLTPDGVLLVAAGAGGLQAFDAADPDLGGLSVAALDGIVEQAALIANSSPLAAVVAAGDAGLHVVSLADPTALVALGSTSLGALAWAHDLVIDPPWAWVASGEAGLSTVDIGAFDAPALTAQLTLAGPALGVALSGGHVYVAAGDAGLQVVDVSSSAVPAAAGALLPSVEGWSHAVASAGGVAYLAHGGGGLVVCDVSEPASPYQLGVLPISGLATDVAVAQDGATLWLAIEGQAVMQVDVSDPWEPAVLEVVTVPGARGLLPDDGDLIVAASEQLLRLSVSAGAVETSAGRVFGTSLDLAVDASGRAIVAQGRRGLEVLVASTDGVARVGALALEGRAVAVDVGADHAWLATEHGGLVGITLGPTGAAELAGAVTLGADALDVALAGPIAFVALGEAGLRLVDVSEADDPTPLFTTLPTILDAARVAVDGTMAAVADRELGVHILDITAPASPLVLPMVGLAEGARDVALEDGLAVVAAGDDGLVVLDLSTPATPAIMGTLALPGQGAAERVWILDGVAWVAWRPLGLWAVDLASPEAPVTLGLEDLHLPYAMAPHGADSAWLAQADGGVAVLAPVCPGN